MRAGNAGAAAKVTAYTAPMKTNTDPAWLPETREFCRRTGITIMGWGPNMIVVGAKSPDRAREIASQLGQLGFKTIASEDDANAGLLSLSPNPDAISSLATEQLSQGRYADFSRRPLSDLFAPAFELLISLTCFWFFARQAPPKSWIFAALASLLFVLFIRDGLRIWGWSLQTAADELRIRRHFAWTEIPWTEIRSVEAVAAGGRNQETVTLTLTSTKSLNVGTFGYPFARALRDHLREQIAMRRGAS